MKPLIALSFFLCLYSIAIAQKSLIDGWVELNNGDTLYGKITERDWNVNPSSIDFLKGNNTTYAVSQLKSFGIVSGDIYKRYTVIKHLLPNRETDLFPEDETKQDTVTIWLKMIVQAEKSLGALYQSDRAYFYSIDKTDKTTELRCSNGIKNFEDDKYRSDPRYKKTVIIENADYKNQLNLLFSDKIDQFDASTIDYNEGSLGKLFRKMNNVKQSASANSSFYLGITAGVSLFKSSIGSTYPANYYQGALLNEATEPFVRVSFNFQKAKKRNRVSFVPELGLSLFNTKGTKPDVSRNNLAGFDIKNVFLEVGITTKVYLNPGAKAKAFIAGGVNSLIRMSGKNVYSQYDPAGNTVATANEPEQPSFIVAPSITVGCDFSKFGIFTNYQYIGNLLTHIGSKWTISRLSAGFSYYFKK